MSRENEQNDVQGSGENSGRQQTGGPNITPETVRDAVTNEVHRRTSSLVDKLFGDFIYAWKSVSMLYKIALAIVIIALVAKIRYGVTNGTKWLLLALLIATVVEYFEAKKLNESNGSGSASESSGTSSNGGESSSTSDSGASQSASESTAETTETTETAETTETTETAETTETPVADTATTVADNVSSVVNEVIDNVMNHETSNAINDAANQVINDAVDHVIDNVLHH